MKKAKDLIFTILAPFFSQSASGHHGSYPPAMLSHLTLKGVTTSLISREKTNKSSFAPRIGYAAVHPLAPLVNLRLLLYFLMRRRENHIVYMGEGTPELAMQLILLLINPRVRLVIAILSIGKMTFSHWQTKIIEEAVLSKRLMLYVDGPVLQKELSNLGISATQTPLYSLAPLVANVPLSGHKNEHLRFYFVARSAQTVQQFLDLEPELCPKCEYSVHPPEELVGKIVYLRAKEAPREVSQHNYFTMLASFDRAIVIYPEEFKSVSAKVLDLLRLGIPVVIQEDTATALALECFGGFRAIDFSDRTQALTCFSHSSDVSSFSRRQAPLSIAEYLDDIINTVQTHSAIKLRFRAFLFSVIFYLITLYRWITTNAKQRLIRSVRF
jgi:hypothetical protein